MRISALEPKGSPNWQGRQGSDHWDLGKKFEFFLKYSRSPCLSSTASGTWLPLNKHLLNGDSIYEMSFLTLTSHPPRMGLGSCLRSSQGMEKIKQNIRIWNNHLGHKYKALGVKNQQSRSNKADYKVLIKGEYSYLLKPTLHDSSKPDFGELIQFSQQI